jgi:hypothetical protein
MKKFILPVCNECFTTFRDFWYSAWDPASKFMRIWLYANVSLSLPRKLTVDYRYRYCIRYGTRCCFYY